MSSFVTALGTQVWNTDKPAVPSIPPSSAAYQHLSGPSLLTDIDGRVKAIENAHPQALQVGQLIVSVMMLVGVGGIVECLGTGVWKAIGTFPGS